MAAADWRIVRRGAIVAMAAVLAGCASYHPQKLPDRPDLAGSLAGLDRTVPRAAAGGPARQIDVGRPLTIDDVGLLAILNNPGLKSERARIGAARAGVLQASLLPNPSASFEYGALLGGPATTSSVASSLSEDIAALVTRGARVKSAQARLGQVDAELLWREWQVAQKARQLAVGIAASDRSIALTRRQIGLLSRELAQVRTALAAGNVKLTALAPLLAAEAAAQQSFARLRLDRQKNWQALDALLDLEPSVRFTIVWPTFAPLPADIGKLVTNLPARRPDLVALRYGYRSAEQDVRAAILGQFPAFALGVSYASDTSAVETVGPTFTLSLPLFNRNQGHIAGARATRALLREEYRARIDRAAGKVQALTAQLASLAADLKQTRKAAAAASSLAETARRAYAQGNLDQRALTDYETTALERALQVVAFERQIGEDRIFLAVELGLGLPKTRIAPVRTASR